MHNDWGQSPASLSGHKLTFAWTAGWDDGSEAEEEEEEGCTARKNKEGHGSDGGFEENAHGV